MLDLKELERNLDAALEKETPESFNAWLMEKRSKQLIVGRGIINVDEQKKAEKLLLVSEPKP